MNGIEKSSRVSKDYTCSHCGELVKAIEGPGGIFLRGFCQCPGAVEERKEWDREVAEEKAQRVQDQILFRKQKAGLVGRLEEMTFERFEAEYQPEPCKTTLEFTGEDGASLILWSEGYGTGKTHLAVATLDRWIEEGGNGRFCHLPSFLRRIRGTFGPEPKESEDAVLRDIENTGLLVLDDLGKEKHSEWQQMTIYTLIDHRYIRRLPMVITMNLKPAELEGRIGSASVSRLLEVTEFVHVEGKDYRLRGMRGEWMA